MKEYKFKWKLGTWEGDLTPKDDSLKDSLLPDDFGKFERSFWGGVSNKKGQKKKKLLLK